MYRTLEYNLVCLSQATPDFLSLQWTEADPSILMDCRLKVLFQNESSSNRVSNLYHLRPGLVVCYIPITCKKYTIPLVIARRSISQAFGH